MTILKTRFLASLAFVAALLVGSAAHAGVKVTASDIHSWSNAVEVEWTAGDTTRKKSFYEDETTPDGLQSLREAADHVDAGGTAVVEWSLNEAGLYEIDVTLQ